MENEIQPQKKKWYKKWWVITLFVILALIVIGFLGDSENKNSFKERLEQGKEKAEQKESTTPNQNIQKEQKVNGNQEETEVSNIEPENTSEEKITEEIAEEESKISRSEIINKFPEFKFTKGVTIDNEDNYVGKAEENCMIQIIGSNSDISSISFTSTIDPQSVSLMDKQSEYFNKLLDMLIPGTKSYELIDLNDTGDKITKGDYEISYTYMELGGGVYTETHTFK
jgi:hypothetical protein